MTRCRLGTWNPHVHYLDDLYWARVWRSIHERADEIGADLVELPSPDDPSDDAAYDDVIVRTRAADVTVVLDWPFVEEQAIALLEAGIGIVHLSETTLEHPRLAAPEGLERVAFDLMQRAIEATSQRGTILTVGGGMQLGSSDDGASRLRGSTFAAATCASIRHVHVPTFWDERSTDQVVRRLRGSSDVVDAIVGFSDRVAACARTACLRLGLADTEVPTFGINGTPDAIAAILSGTMTGTAEGSAEEVGRRAVDVAIAMAGNTRYPRRFPYRFRYVDASSARTVAASMLIDFGSALRTPRALASSEHRSHDRMRPTIEAIDAAFLQAASSTAALSTALDAVCNAYALDRLVALWFDPDRPHAGEPRRWCRLDERGRAEVVTVPHHAWDEVADLSTPSTEERVDADGGAWRITYLPLVAAGTCFGCVEWWHGVGGVPSIALLDELASVTRHLAAAMELRGRTRDLASGVASVPANRDVVVWIESAVDGKEIVDALADHGAASIEIRPLPSSRRESWERTALHPVDGQPNRARVVVAVLARWTPEAHAWISRWEPVDRSTPLLIVSDRPWSSKAIRALPNDLPVVVHSTLTLPPSALARWVLERIETAERRTDVRRWGAVRSVVASIHATFEATEEGVASDVDREIVSRPRERDEGTRRAFRTVMGLSPRAYAARHRVHRAMRWLRTTDLSITEIGMREGWSDPAQFSSAFRKVVGVSPRAYRVSVGRR